jgi:predicted molibdopterin-dependent oxidoreductase YjgC
LLCVKGRFGWSYLHHPDRLTRPLVRSSLVGEDGDTLVETNWDTALDLVARRLAATAERSSPAPATSITARGSATRRPCPRSPRRSGPAR